jgi:NAD(P)H-quinone oxidoreductase subunit 2
MNSKLLFDVLLPELIVLAGIVLTILFSVCPRSKQYTADIAAWALFFASVASLRILLPLVSIQVLSASFVHDSLSSFFRLLIYLVAFVVVLAAKKYLEVLESPAEYYPILLAATLGAALLTGVNDMLSLFVALETLGLAAILLTAYARSNQSSNEAGIKYLISSAVSTSILLLGFSFLYGVSGLTNFSQIAKVLINTQALGTAFVSPYILSLIIVCLLATISFKLAAVPFQNWSPDVYTGAPTTTTLFLSVISKTAAFAFAIRLLSLFYPIFSSHILLWNLLALIAALSIIFGNYVGVVQMINKASVKRLFAYSSIAQAGYLMIGLAVFDFKSLASLVLYLMIYAVMNSAAFLVIIFFEKETGSDKISDYAGLFGKRPLMSLALVLALVNLAGLPFIPAAFIAKFFLFSSAFASGLALGKVLSLIGLLGSVVALYYYIYLAKIIIVDTPSDLVKALPEKQSNSAMQALTLVLLILLSLIALFGMEACFKIASQVVIGLA